VKRTISVALQKGKEQEAAEIVKYLKEEKHLLAKEDRKIEPQTLKKWTKDQLEAGKALPPDELLSIYEYSFAKIIDGKPQVVFDGE